MDLFGFFSKWRTNHKIKSLESALQLRPTPVLYLQLADAHKSAGNIGKAAQVLKLGAARFPSAPEILRRQAEAERGERENEKKRLLEKIQTHPNPILYARLAELYKADGEIQKTVETCQRGVKVFPKYGGTYLVLGQIYVEKKDWKQAVVELERSVELDKYNYLALKLLAQVYLELTRPVEAVARLESILYFAPGDEAILELLKKAKEQAGQPLEPKTGSDPVKAGRSTVRLKSVDKPPATAPSKSQKIERTKAASASEQRDRVLTTGLASLRGVAGVSGAILVDQFGLVMASDLSESIDEGLAGALITNVFRTTSTNAVKLGVGEFEDGLIEGTGGHIHIVHFEQMVLAVFAGSETKMGLLEKSIRDFAMTVVQPR